MTEHIYDLAEIINQDHRLVAKLEVAELNEENKVFKTMIPRNYFGSPIRFFPDQIYNVVLESDDHITFFQVKYQDLINNDENANFVFEIKNLQSIKNVRKEKRENVEREAVISDFDGINIATILDISNSGMKIEVFEEIDTDYVEIFYDDENTPLRALGKVVWKKKEGQNKYFYGLDIEKR